MGDIEREYEENMDVVKRLREKTWEGYMLICKGEIIGVYSSFKEAVEKAREKYKVQALILEPKDLDKQRIIELGLPVSL